MSILATMHQTEPHAGWGCRLAVGILLLGMAFLMPAAARAQGDGPGAQLLFPAGTNVFVPTWLNMEMNSDFSQSILNLDADVDADIFLAVFARGFASATAMRSSGWCRSGAAWTPRWTWPSRQSAR